MALSTAITLDPGTRIIRCKLKRNNVVAELLSPILKTALKHIIPQLLALPDRIVGILNCKRLEHGHIPFQPPLIERRNLLDKNLQRPSVRDYVVHGEQEQMVFLTQLKQAHAQQ